MDLELTKLGTVGNSFVVCKEKKTVGRELRPTHRSHVS
jgi:hypothetical protein